MSLEVSARKCSWLSKLTKVPVSPSTCLRLAGRSVISPRDDLIHIGIDDWAWRKGHTYGTILVDRETGKSVDLLRSREKDDIVRWLKAHPSIETVTRDRAEYYSQSVNIALPSAIQIADRFHLVVNYPECVQKIIRQMLPALTRIDINIHQKYTTNIANDQNIQRIIDLARGGESLLTEYKRQLIDKARKLYQQGHSKTRVAKILNLNFRTVQKYIDNDPEHALPGRVPQLDYASYLDDLIRGYCEDEKLSVVYRRIESKGSRGTQRGLGTRFGTLFKEGKQNYRKAATKNLSTRYSGRTISPRKLTIYLTNKHYEKILTPDDVEMFRQLRSNNPLIEELWTLSEEFRKIFEKNSTLLFKEWIDKVMHSTFGSLRRFVKGLS